MGREPNFVKVGPKALCRWSDVADWLGRKRMQRKDYPHG
jgi:hypothetical protein